MTRRSRAREVAFQALYQDDLNPRSSPALAEELLRRRLGREGELIKFAQDLLAGTRRHRPELDQRIEQAAENWSLARMAATDRSVLRLGAYEILHSQTPDRVAINEAVELARRYGSAHSAQFVNGILDRLMHEKDTTGNDEARMTNDETRTTRE